MINSKGFEENLYYNKEGDITTGIIRVHSGIYVDIFNPKPDMFEIEDIAHGLSMLPRFGGHTKIFYPVAQHSIEVMELVGKSHKYEALLHDASEAYLMDIPSPIKKLLTNYSEIEDNLMKCISEKFGFNYPLHNKVKEADEIQLKYEWNNFVINLNTTVTYSQNKVKQRFLDIYNLLR